MSIVRHALPLIAALALAACASSHCVKESDHFTAEHLFDLFCASCHGPDARGNGPVAPFLSVKVPDLTLIAARNGGDYPAEKVFRLIDGQADDPVHGTRHMPVWGYEFFGTEGDDQSAHRQATVRVESLVTFLRTLQRPN